MDNSRKYKVFISHKKEDALIASKIRFALLSNDIEAYLDILDPSTVNDGKALTDHIKKELNDCTDILVVVSEKTRFSQWVYFEVGMSAQIDMPTATYLQDNIELPSFLSYWPSLKSLADIDKYVKARTKTYNYMQIIFDNKDVASHRKYETDYFYNILKSELKKSRGEN